MLTAAWDSGIVSDPESDGCFSDPRSRSLLAMNKYMHKLREWAGTLCIVTPEKSCIRSRTEEDLQMADLAMC